MQPMGGCRLLHFAKSKNGTKCKNFAVLLCFYVNTFILLYFLRGQEEGPIAPLATPLNPPQVGPGPGIIFSIGTCLKASSINASITGRLLLHGCDSLPVKFASHI